MDFNSSLTSNGLILGMKGELTLAMNHWYEDIFLLLHF
ncbi:TPA: hypothetical protein JBE46_11555 [Legionella pneumophila subsp. pneumophila]|nr:hypothetical protein D7216_04235 [Legionella pneumophila]HAT8831617.1 hypothetical protein [Legionella pneumophila subsp. pneumophila]RYW88899.1 hypothetical protein D7221_06435 [Legionella pneumophila]RYX05481.1 hypothetical protein D7214_12525 [Legionella pneumophila]RYX23239.1 hypothetical protein D7267_09655 [Legionella pneumophila]